MRGESRRGKAQTLCFVFRPRAKKGCHSLSPAVCVSSILMVTTCLPLAPNAGTYVHAGASRSARRMRKRKRGRWAQSALVLNAA